MTTDERPATQNTTQDVARDGLRRAETGEPAGAAKLEDAEKSEPASAEAIEQEVADGPEGRGVSR